MVWYIRVSARFARGHVIRMWYLQLTVILTDADLAGLPSITGVTIHCISLSILEKPCVQVLTSEYTWFSMSTIVASVVVLVNVLPWAFHVIIAVLGFSLATVHVTDISESSRTGCSSPEIIGLLGCTANVKIFKVGNDGGFAYKVEIWLCKVVWIL